MDALLLRFPNLTPTTLTRRPAGTHPLSVQASVRWKHRTI